VIIVLPAADPDKKALVYAKILELLEEEAPAK